MKHSISAAIVTFLILSTTPVFAQSAKDMEASSFIMCQEMIGTASEAEACTDWLVSSVSAATYRSRFSEIAKFLSNDNILKYRVNADKKLVPGKCEPMTAFELNSDILESLSEQSERDSRAKRLVEWGNKLAPQQMLRAASSIAALDDFSHLMTIPAVRSFITKSRDEITNNNTNNDAIQFLKRLETTDPSLITPSAQVMLLNHDIENSQFQTAKTRILQLDLDKLPQKLREETAKKVINSAKKIFGDVNFGTASCYPEFVQTNADNAEITVLKKLSKLQDSSVISAHIAVNLIRKCDIEGTSAMIFDVFATDASSPDTALILDKYIAYAETQKSDLLTASIIHQTSRLSEQALSIFKKKYAVKLRGLALDAGRRALERQDAAKAAYILEPLSKFADKPNEIRLELGRALQMQKKSVQARQIWAEITESEGRSTLAEKAWYFSYQSFKRDKKANDAESLKAQFEDKFPASDTSRW